MSQINSTDVTQGWSLKGYRTFRGMDGSGFNSTLLLNGKAVGTADNEGSGGPDLVRFNTPEAEAAFDQAAKAYAGDHMAEKYFEWQDHFVDRLIRVIEDARVTKNNAVKKGFPITVIARKGVSKLLGAGYFEQEYYIGIMGDDQLPELRKEYDEVEVVGRATEVKCTMKACKNLTSKRYSWTYTGPGKSNGKTTGPHFLCKPDAEIARVKTKDFKEVA